MTKVYITESGYKLNVASTLRMTASEAETLLDGVFEPVLGNPDADGYVLSSTTGGTRSWVAQSGGGGDVDDLTTTTGSSTNMLRVAAAGGLEYRTTAQVLSDIGAAPTASPTFTGTVTLPTTVASVIKPASDSTTALQLTNAAGTALFAIDTTNKRLTWGASGSYLDANTDGDISVKGSLYTFGVRIGGVNNWILPGSGGASTGITYAADRNYSRAHVFTDSQHRSKNFDHGTPTDPTIYVHSATDPDTDNTQWIGFWHNTTDGVIDTGTGDLRIESIVDFRATMGDSTKTVGTDAPADWVEIQIGGTTYYLPAYAA